MILTDKKTNLSIAQGGFYEYEIDGVESFHLTIESRLDCEVIFTCKNITDLYVDVNVKDNTTTRILWVNENEKSKVQAQYHLDKHSFAKVGYYELNDNESELEATFHLDGIESKVETIITTITSKRKHYVLESIHHVPMTSSDMNNYEISKEDANYKIVVSGNIEKGAIQSKAHQITRVLTTSENQKSEAVPLLLIDENDVEASHANTMGKMDDEYLYYLTSRGIDLSQAKDLLTLSYLMPISKVLTHEKTKERLESSIREMVGL